MARCLQEFSGTHLKQQQHETLLEMCSSDAATAGEIGFGAFASFPMAMSTSLCESHQDMNGSSLTEGGPAHLIGVLSNNTIPASYYSCIAGSVGVGGGVQEAAGGEKKLAKKRKSSDFLHNSAKGGSRSRSSSSSSRNQKQSRSNAFSQVQKEEEEEGNNKEETSSAALLLENSKGMAAAAPKPDYIHVRARRGQATDSHSLAERVRREKISERMRCLQELVPGCSKVVGRAGMLDEIINYVQSLQRQVEFLSMKLAAINPAMLEMSVGDVFIREAGGNNLLSNGVVLQLDDPITSFGAHLGSCLQQQAAAGPPANCFGLDMVMDGPCMPLHAHNLIIPSLPSPLMPDVSAPLTVNNNVSWEAAGHRNMMYGSPDSFQARKETNTWFQADNKAKIGLPTIDLKMEMCEDDTWISS